MQTCAVLPRGVPEGQTGPRLTAFTGLLMGCFRQSKSRAKLFLEQWLGQPCSTGLTVKLQNLTTRALQPVYQQLCAALPAQPVLNIDETPTKEAAAKSWLWTFVARGFTVFAVRPTRGAVVLDELLTEKFSGVVGCDRAKMYWQEERLQWCWAHLKRDFQAMADSPHRQARGIGEELLAQTKLLFRRWHRFAAAAITRTGLKQTPRPSAVMSNDYCERASSVVTVRQKAPAPNFCTTASGCGRSWITTACNQRTTLRSGPCGTG